jgi:hypothetical protein
MTMKGSPNFAVLTCATASLMVASEWRGLHWRLCHTVVYTEASRRESLRRMFQEIGRPISN